MDLFRVRHGTILAASCCLTRGNNWSMFWKNECGLAVLKAYRCRPGLLLGMCIEGAARIYYTGREYSKGRDILLREAHILSKDILQ